MSRFPFRLLAHHSTPDDDRTVQCTIMTPTTTPPHACRVVSHALGEAAGPDGPTIIETHPFKSRSKKSAPRKSHHNGNSLRSGVVLRNLTPVSNVLRKATEESIKISDRLMTARQVAAYLNVNERTVLKLVSEGALPGVKIGNQWRFRKAMLDAWLDDQMLGVAPQHLELENRTQAPRRMLDLASCFQPSHIVPELAATTKIGVIEELADSANRLGLVRDKNWFVGALIERENIMPSAVGNGVAFLHTMNRHPEQVVRPFMVLGRSRAGVDFDALDGRPTHLFFVLGLKFHELHLPWLAKLAQLFAHPEATDALVAAPNASAMFDSLSQAERCLFPLHSGHGREIAR